MQEQLYHKQRALRAGIRMSDARRKEQIEEDTSGLVLQYELILGFLQRIGPALAEYPDLNMFYFPIKSEQLLCVYRLADMPEPLPDRKSTRLNSSHITISYAVFCLNNK